MFNSSGAYSAHTHTRRAHSMQTKRMNFAPFSLTILLRLQWFYGDINTEFHKHSSGQTKRTSKRWQHNKQREKSVNDHRMMCVYMFLSINKKAEYSKNGIESHVECFHNEIRFLLLHTHKKHMPCAVVVGVRTIWFDLIWLNWLSSIRISSVRLFAAYALFRNAANRFQTIITALPILFGFIVFRFYSNWM